MILICSDDKEPTTDIVCSWLRYFEKEFIRISNKDVIDIKTVYLNDDFIEVDFLINK